MARLDLGGLRDLWYRIDDIFARITEAAGSLVLSGTSLVLNSVSGGTLSSVDLNGTFATDAEAAHGLSISDSTLNLTSVNGGNLSSVNLSALVKKAAASLTNDALKLLLKDGNGKTLSTVNMARAVADFGDGRYGSYLKLDGERLYLTAFDTNVNRNYVSVPSFDWVRRNFIASAGISKSGNVITISFYDGNGDLQDSVSFTVS